jgi:hypothetical protein
MTPFIIVKTRAGSAYVRPERVVAVNPTDPGECIVLMTDGVTIVAKEPAAEVVARLEAQAKDDSSSRKER